MSVVISRFAAMPPVAFHFITAVWGDAYTRLYRDTVLPTQASAGNLGAFVGRDEPDIYWVYTTRDAAGTIRAAPVFEVLSKQITVRFVYIDDLFRDDRPKHTVVTEVHKRSIETAFRDRAAMVFLCPDAIWSDGSFAALLDLTARGFCAVMMPGIRLCKETFLPEMDQRFAPDERGIVTVGPRPLTTLALDHLHQISATLFWDAPRLNPHMSHLYFRVNRDDAATGEPATEPTSVAGGFAARCFHLHPFMVLPHRFDTRFSSTIDGDFVPLACPDPATVHVVTDSDEMVVYELSDSSMNIPPRWDRDGRLTATAHWVRQFADPYHRRYARLTCRIHDGTATASDWNRATDEAERVIGAVHERRHELDFIAVRLIRRVVLGGVRVTRPVVGRMGRWISGAMTASGGKPVEGGEGGEGGLATGADPIGSLGPGRPGLGRRVAWGWRGRVRMAWFTHRAQLYANATQWRARARRRWWLVSMPVSQRWHRLVARQRQVGWLRLLGVRSTLRRVMGHPPRDS